MTHDVYKDVGDFHDKFGLPAFVAGGKVFKWDDEFVEFRLKFLEEELEEFRRGIYTKNHAEMFDALIDLVYVAVGTAHIMGYPWKSGWNLVQEANMAKVRGKKDGSDSKRGSGWDVVKPPGWTPPNIAGLLELLGFDFPQEAEPPLEDGCPGCRRAWSVIDEARKKTSIAGVRYERDGILYCSRLCSGEE